MEIIYLVLVVAVPLVLSITVHEVAHGYVAKLCGDTTAQRAGRLTLNPIAHIDPVGTLLLPISLLVLNFTFGGGLGMIFGWAKPVPVQINRLRRLEKDMVLVAAAGPLSNIAMALIWSIILQTILGGLNLSLSEPSDEVMGFSSEIRFFFEMALYGVVINLTLALVNLIPLLPFDGGRIVYGLVPQNVKSLLLQLEPYGMIIFITLVLTGGLAFVLEPLRNMLLVLFL